MSLSRELVHTVRSRIKEKPDLSSAELAMELNATEADVVTALPLNMRMRAKADDLTAIWARALRWKHATFSTSLPDIIPKARHGGTGAATSQPFEKQSMADMPQGTAVPALSDRLSNNLAVDDIGSVWFVSKPLHGRESHAVRLFDKQGGHLFSVYLGSDHLGHISPEDMADFEDLRKKFGVIPKPKMHCKGCGSCTCGNKPHPRGELGVSA